MYRTEALTEADRLMTVCNSCRYCEGLCAVFPAMELRRSFDEGDLNYLANLCHSCGACYYDCQFSPPHAFAVNMPVALAAVRADSYAAYAWPGALRGLFARNGLAVAVLAALSVAGFLFALGGKPAAGGFYGVMAHNTMAWLFGAVFVYALVALWMGVRALWRDSNRLIPVTANPAALWQAVKDAASLRYLDGGGVGCYNEGDQPRDRRAHSHHATAYGFALCLAATSVATLYHYLLGREAPYLWYDLPVLLGTAGGIGLVVGPIGLLVAKFRRDPAVADPARLGMDVGFTAMLLATAVTGLGLLVWRGTGAMPALLAVHLGVVFSLFLTMPYGKFVHGIYRFVALVRYARERQMLEAGEIEG